jgi:curved DNA-binding protein CbpA
VTDSEIDAYRVLRVDPAAEDFILEAAFRALARRFHPDGASPHDQMAEINRAYDLVRTPERRKRYDRLRHQVSPMGPGSEGAMGSAGNPAGEPWALRRPAPPPPADDRPGALTIDFGRYAGWSLKDLAKHDPDYLRWLSRHSSGVRYRNVIMRLLPDDVAAPARR